MPIEERRAGVAPSASARSPWSADVDRLLADLGVDPTSGLTAAEAERRLAEAGPNELAVAAPIGRWRRLAAQFSDPVVYLLLGAIVISLLTWLIEGGEGAPIDAIVIAVIVVVNAAVGQLQEHRAEEAMAALRDLTEGEATVVRDGSPVRIAAWAVVPGDVLELAEGDLVPADGRVTQSSSLRIAEAALTGESVPVGKSAEAVDSEAALGDRGSMVYSGTAVTSGRGRAVVTATGQATEMGRIATLLGETEVRPTPLRREIDWIGRVLGIAVVIVAALVVLAIVALDGWPTGAALVDALLIGVSLAVAAVPEGLPAVLTVILALGVQRMSRRNALVKRLASVETLGSSTVICSDKTGTLTRNEMTLGRLLIAGHRLEVSAGHDLVLLPGRTPPDARVIDEARWTLVVGALASVRSSADGDRAALPTDPTERAIVLAQRVIGEPAVDLLDRFEQQLEIPFSSERKLMTTVNVDRGRSDRILIATKGAPDVVLDHCTAERAGGEIVPLSPSRRAWWTEAVEGLAGQAFRTLAIAYRSIDPSSDGGARGDAVENDLVLAGLVGIVDPPRPEAKAAIELATEAGIRVAMITGDHPATARRIATQLGIIDRSGAVVTGDRIAAIADDELIDVTRSVSVYARVAPEQKLRIVEALTGQGEIVAMTGDGVNDAPALKAADIGIAMGQTGTGVSKEAADMILADDNFATIVTAVEEGRTIYHNIRSFLRYLLSSNVGEVLTVFGGVLGAAAIGLEELSGDGPASPLLAVQILWINLVTDAGPALALGVDPAAPGLMARRPRPPSQRVIDRRMQWGILLVGFTMAVATLTMLDLRLAGGLLGGSGDLTTARTGAFTALVLAQLFNTFNARSDTESAFGQLRTNPWLIAAIALSLGLQIAIVHIPVLHAPFGTTGLSLTDWALAAALASSVLWVSEVRKLLLRRRTTAADLD